MERAPREAKKALKVVRKVATRVAKRAVKKAIKAKVEVKKENHQRVVKPLSLVLKLAKKVFEKEKNRKHLPAVQNQRRKHQSTGNL